MSKIVVNYKVNGEEWKKAVDEAFDKLNQKVTIDGFRKGHAPRKVFEQKYGQGEILIEASDKLIQNHFYDILNEKNLELVAEPKVDLLKLSNEELEVNYTFFVNPEVKLGEYKDLKVKKEKVKVTKEEVEHEVGHILDRYAELVSKDGAVEEGDTAIIDFKGFKDNEAFDGGSAEGYSLEIGSHSFIPGFEEGVVGMKKEENKDIELSFPEDYMAKDLAGQKVVFNVTVHDIKKRVIPELDEEFFKDLDMEGVTNKEELNKVVEEEIKTQKEHDAENKYIDDLLEAASKNMTIDLDEEIVDAEVERMYKEFTNRLKMQGIDEELYFAYAKVTKEKVKEDMKKEAETRVKYRYLLEAIVKAEKIEISEKDAKAELKKMAEDYKMTEEDLLKEFNNSLEVLKYDLAMRKAIEVLKENN